MTEQIRNYRLTFKFFWKVFLLSAFPIHIWNFLMIFKDIEFVSERNEMWSAIGYAGYSLMFALVESLIFGIILWLITLPLPKKWGEKRTLVVVISIYYVLAGASALEHAAHAFEQYRIAKQFLYGLEHFTNLTYTLIAGAILLAIVILMLVIFKLRKGQSVLAEILDRLILLSYLYLVIDAAGIVVVLIRNFSETL